MPIVGENGIKLREFFAFTRERYQILLRRRAGKLAPWTDDQVLRTYPFTNVFSEDDKTTAWFREHVRNVYRDQPNLALLSTVIFRWFTRIEVGEAIFCQDAATDAPTAFEEFLGRHDVRVLRRAILAYVGKKGPFVTGAYIIAGPPGMKKLDGVLQNIKMFCDKRCKKCGDRAYRCAARDSADRNERGEARLEALHAWLREFDYMGPFHAYECVTDLRHTSLLDNAVDVNTWCNVGPGAKRGLNRVLGLAPGDTSLTNEKRLRHMGQILSQAWSSRFNWPREWPRWSMREVEFQLCEADKYWRAQEPGGMARMKRRFRHGGG